MNSVRCYNGNMLFKNVKKEDSLIRYRGCIPEILRYQIITKLLLFGIGIVFQLARGGLLWTTTRSAVTSGDLGFLLSSVQGWLLMIVGFLILVVYVVFDVNAMILLSSRVLHGKPIVIREILKEALTSLRNFRSVRGILLILYVAFLVPLIGVGFKISITESLYIPDFIDSFIVSRRWLNIGFNLGMFVLLLVTVRYIFTFHYVILHHKTVPEAIHDAGKIWKSHRKDFIVRYGRFLLRTLLVGVLFLIAAGIVFFLILLAAAFFGDLEFRGTVAVFAEFVLLCVQIFQWLFTPFHMLALTRIFESYTKEDEGEYIPPVKRRHYFMYVLGCCLIFGFVFLGFLERDQFDEIFPTMGKTAIIAHRGGGTLGAENTVAGMEKAIALGTYGSEIDVQRTADGNYIVNHDDTFKRLAGVNLTPAEMTTEEIKALTITDDLGYSGSFATYEEFLDAAKDRIHLFVELKGDTADEQMADDVVRIASEKGMLDQVTFICLKYPVIRYLETTYPEADTGYLCYASIGDIEGLDADILILEEEIASDANIRKIHAAEKQVLVWTVNSQQSMLKFYAREADGIITDEVADAHRGMQILREMMDPEQNEEELGDFLRVGLYTLFVLW